MNKITKKFISVLVALTMLAAMSAAAVATEGEEEYIAPEIADFTENTYVESDGTFVDEVVFFENGVYSRLVTAHAPDGTYTVTVEQGDYFAEYEGVMPEQLSAPPSFIPPLGLPQRAATASGYPIYTPYWFAGTYIGSQNGTALTIALIAAAIAGISGVASGWATTIGGAVYAALGGNIYSNIYYSMDKYYATTDYGPGMMGIYHHKYITRVYSNSARTALIAGPITREFDALEAW
jgi:hypothetical protein